MRHALNAGFKHFCVSLGVALVLWLWIVLVWYPWPYYSALHVVKLLLLMFAVDVVCGPILTMVVWNKKKQRRELFLDIGLIALIQILAASYGVVTAAHGRPVFLAYEVDRMKVVTASEIPQEDLHRAKPDFRTLSWTGPRVIGTRSPVSPDEKLRSIELSVEGLEPSLRPDWWQDYRLNVPQAISRARPIEEIRESGEKNALLLEKEMRKIDESGAQVGWVPMVSAKGSDWVVLINKISGDPVGYLNIDGFDLKSKGVSPP